MNYITAYFSEASAQKAIHHAELEISSLTKCSIFTGPPNVNKRNVTVLSSCPLFLESFPRCHAGPGMLRSLVLCHLSGLNGYVSRENKWEQCLTAQLRIVQLCREQQGPWGRSRSSRFYLSGWGHCSLLTIRQLRWFNGTIHFRPLGSFRARIPVVEEVTWGWIQGLWGAVKKNDCLKQVVRIEKPGIPFRFLNM